MTTYEARTNKGILFFLTAYTDDHAFAKAWYICGHEPSYVGRA
jgi:hypothetical protein